MANFELELRFSADLTTFLRSDARDQGLVRRMLTEKTAVKDVIEACGVPHSEVDLIVAVETYGTERYAVHFGWPVQIPMRLEIFGVPAPTDVLPQTQRLQTKTWSRFVADGHLGKLARNLRLLGLDTAYERDADDCRMLEIMAAEDRALLTRDRRLLMHSIVRHGYCPRSTDAEEQTREVPAKVVVVMQRERLGREWIQHFRLGHRLEQGIAAKTTRIRRRVYRLRPHLLARHAHR